MDRERFGEYRRTLTTMPAWTHGNWGAKNTDAFRMLGALDGLKYPKPKPDPEHGGVVLLGKAYGHMLAPWDEEGWEFWGLNLGPVRWSEPPLEHYQRWFQLHPPRYLKVHYPEGIEELARLWGRKRGIRLYMDKHYRAYPDSERYPREEIELLTPRGYYHTSSMDWMLALAIHEGFRRIICAGFCFTTFPLTNGEPLSGRPCFEYWCGVADGHGVELQVLGPTGHLFKNTHLAVTSNDLQYGYDHEPALDLSLGDEGWKDVR